MYQFEVCANSVESCLAAQEGGAHRVELCAGMPEGGTTPSCGEIKIARELLNIRFHVIIRPRGGDFLYTERELCIMEKDIECAREAGVDGVVFGCLTPEGEIDTVQTQRLIDAAKGMSVTFHRAFDKCINPFKALDQLISLGVDRILTSGQQSTASAGLPLISDLVRKAAGRIIILPGSGVNESNIRRIAIESGAKEFHFSARETIPSEMIYRQYDTVMGVPEVINEYTHSVTTVRRVENTIKALL